MATRATPSFDPFCHACHDPAHVCPTSTAVSTCPQGTYPSGSKCAFCPWGCKNCTSATACTGCWPGSALRDDGTCGEHAPFTRARHLRGGGWSVPAVLFKVTAGAVGCMRFGGGAGCGGCGAGGGGLEACPSHAGAPGVAGCLATLPMRYLLVWQPRQWPRSRRV
jgi:hypothetical protein